MCLLCVVKPSVVEGPLLARRSGPFPATVWCQSVASAGCGLTARRTALRLSASFSIHVLP
eukprot:8896443-Lingulodinium_polyedra.AAC.1